MKPCIFMLSPIGVDGSLEADGTVLYFCSTHCRSIGLAELYVESDGPYKLGKSEDWDDQTICNECYKPLRPPSEAAK